MDGTVCTWYEMGRAVSLGVDPPLEGGRHLGGSFLGRAGST
jgi:hypothetical protein